MRGRSAVIDWLSGRRVDTGSPIITYYVDASRVQQATTVEILQALIKQLVMHHRDLNSRVPRELRSMFENVFAPFPTKRHVANLMELLQRFLHVTPRCFLVVDGIDVLPESEISTFVESLRKIWSRKSSIGIGIDSRLMLFCREILGRQNPLQKIPSSVLLSIRLRDIRPDIHLYVDHEVDKRQCETPVTQDQTLINEIKDVLKSKSEKM